MNSKKEIKNRILLKTAIIFIALLLILFGTPKKVYADLINETVNPSGDDYSGDFEYDDDHKYHWSHSDHDNIASRVIKGAYYHVVDNSRASAELEVKFELIGPGDVSESSQGVSGKTKGKVNFINKVPGKTTRIYIYKVYTSNNSCEIGEIGYADISLNMTSKTEGTLVGGPTVTGSALAAVGMAHKGTSSVSELKISYDGSGAPNCPNFKIASNSNKIYVDNKWHRTIHYESNNTLISFVDPWKNDEIGIKHMGSSVNWYKFGTDAKSTSHSDGPTNLALGKCTITYDSINGEVTTKKYITNVKKPNNTDRFNSTARSGKTYAQKKADPVNVEVGDIVTYKIELKSTFGEKVKVKLEDVLPSDAYLYDKNNISDYGKIYFSGISSGRPDIEIGADSTVTLTVKVKVAPNAYGKTYENQAKTSDAKFVSDGSDMSDYISVPTDSDFYKVADTDGVFIKKYIYKTQSAGNDTHFNNSPSREGYTTATKKSNFLTTDVGDKVTYRVVVKNSYNFSVK